jgi:serine/threonine-protein kinase
MPSLVEIRADVPRELEAVIAKCLEKKPDDRYQSVADFANALAPFAAVASRPSISRIAGILRTSSAPPGTAGSSSTLRSAGTPAPDSDTELSPLGGVTPAKQEKDTQMDWGKSESGARRSRRRAVAAVVLVGVLVVVLGLALQRAGDRAASPVPSSTNLESAPVHSDQGAKAASEPPSAEPPLPAASAHPSEPRQVSPGNPAASAQDAPSVEPVASAKGAAAQPAVTAKRPAAPRPAAAKPDSPVKAAVPASDEEDPLEERR